MRWLVLLALGGCSWVFVRTPTPPVVAESCSDSEAAPIADTVGAALGGIVATSGFVLALNCEGTSGGDGCKGDGGFLASVGLTSLGLAVLYGWSAHHGYHAVAVCRGEE